MGDSQSRHQQTTLEDYNSEEKEGSGSSNSVENRNETQNKPHRERPNSAVFKPSHSALLRGLQEINLLRQVSRFKMGVVLGILLLMLYFASIIYAVQQGYISVKKATEMMLKAEHSLFIAVTSVLLTIYLSRQQRD